ncbi:efflux RND transporter periplasmic adaptor subunit [Kaarinaea lacus]
MFALYWQAHAYAAPATGGGPPPMPVEIASVSLENLVIDISAVGNLVSNESVTLRPEIPGRIQKIHFREGDHVKKNDILVTLDPASYRARLAESEANLKLTKVRYERARQLFDKNLTSRQELDQESALYEQSQARKALDEESLRKTVLRAPFDGILGLRLVSPGDFIKDGDDLVEISDIYTLKLDFQVPEIYLREISSGQRVDIRVDAYPNDTYQGEVYAIAPRLDVASRSVKIRARIPNINGKLRPGMFARVNLRIAERNNAVMIPEEALWPIGLEQNVYRVVDNKAVLTKIVTGYRSAGKVEVLEGLQEGEVIITSGQMKIRDGAPVMPINPLQPAAGSKG